MGQDLDLDEDWDADGWDVSEPDRDDAGWEIEAAPIFDAVAAAFGRPSFGLELDWNELARQEEERRWQSAGYGWE